MAELTFLGTGTSQGVPVISCGCEVCMSDNNRDKRLRASVMVKTRDVQLVIDAGPDFRQQMLRENVKHIDAILLTHEHKDHIAGIDDIRAFNYTQGGAVSIYATRRVLQVIKKDFDYAFKTDKYPGAPEIDPVEIEKDKPFKIKDVEIIPISGMHYQIPVTGFRIGNIAYLTDFNHIPKDQIDKIHGVDILVINALRHEPHLSHFTLTEALHVSRLAHAKKTYFTHISHQMGCYDNVCKELPANTFLAYDGLRIETSED